MRPRGVGRTSSALYSCYSCTSSLALEESLEEEPLGREEVDTASGTATGTFQGRSVKSH